MKWVLIVWTTWIVDGGPSIPVKSAEIYYSTQQACLDAMFEVEKTYLPYTKDGLSYTIQCKERDVE